MRGWTGRVAALLFSLLLSISALAETPLSDPVRIRAAGWQGDVVSATDGRDFLVVWSDGRGGGAEIYATRVRADGTVLDPEGLLLSDRSAIATQPAVAWTGRNYIVVYRTDYGCVFQHVTANGEVGGTRPIFDPWTTSPRIASAGDGTALIAGMRAWTEIDLVRVDAFARAQPIGRFGGANRFDLACTPRECLAAWEYFDHSIRGLRMRADGERIDAEPRVFATNAINPALAANDDRFLLVYREPYEQRIWAGELDAEPALIHESDAMILNVDAASSGRGFIVAWTQQLERVRDRGVADDTTELRVRRIGDGAAETLRVLRAGSTWWQPPAVASNGATHLAAWIEGQTTNKIAAAISRDGRSLNRIPIARSAALQESPAMARCGDHVLVAWSEEPSVFARRFDLRGNPIDAQPIALSASPRRQRFPAVACDVVTWYEGEQLLARRLDHAEVRTLTTKAEGHARAAVVAIDDGLAVLHDHDGRVVLTRVRADGAIERQDVGARDFSGYALAQNGAELVAVWTQTNHGLVNALRFTRDGVRLDREPIVVASSQSLADSPSIACDGSECILAWWALRGGVRSARLVGSDARPTGEPFFDFSEYREPSIDRYYPTVLRDGSAFTVIASALGGWFGRALHDGIAAKEEELFRLNSPRVAQAEFASTPDGLLIVYPRAAYGAEGGGAQRLFLARVDH